MPDEDGFDLPTPSLSALRERLEIGTFWTDLKGERTWWSDDAYRALGFEPGSVKPGRETLREVVLGTDIELMALALAGAIEKRIPIEVVIRVQHRDGSIRRVRITGAVEIDDQGQPTGVSGTVVDVTHRLAFSDAQERGLEALRTADHMRLVLDSIPVRVFWKDGDLVYVGCNTRFAQDAGFSSPDEVVGKSDHEMGWKDQAELYRDDDRAVMASGLAKLNYEEPQTTPDGKTLWLRTSKIPLRDTRGTVVGVLGTYEDITEYKQLLDSSQHQARLEALGRLAGGVAHDFNNLLTVIIGNAEMAGRAGASSAAIETMLEDIVASADRARALTGQLLAFARRQVIRPRVVHAGNLLEGMRPLFAPLLGGMVELAIHVEEGLDAIRIDPGQLEQVFLNLAVNARDAMPDGGRLSFRLENQPGGPSFPSAHVLITVQDSGVGIPPDLLPHIFDPFRTTKAVNEGTGLGLATCLGIVEQNGGQITATSTPGQGARFEVRFPRVLEDPEDPKSFAPPTGEAPRGDECVLVVEDEELVRRFCVEALERLGYRVLVAPTGTLALSLAAEHRGEIDLVVCDVMLPDMGGWQVAERLRDDDPELRVLIVSGYDEGLASGDLTPLEGARFLGKPYNTRQLALAVRGLLDR